MYNIVLWTDSEDSIQFFIYTNMIFKKYSNDLMVSKFMCEWWPM